MARAPRQEGNGIGAPRVLVRRTCALGDLILSLPFFQALGARLPGHEIHLLGQAAHGRLLQAAGLVSRWFPESGSGWHRLYGGTANGSAAPLVPDPALYDAVYLFVADPARSPLLESVGRLVPGVHGIPARPPAGAQIPAWRFFADLLGPEGGSVGRASGAVSGAPPLPWTWTAGESHRYAVFHVGSGSPRKNWPPDAFASVMARLAQLLPQSRLCIVEGPWDREAAQAVSCRLPPGLAPEIVRIPELADLARFLGGAALVVGNDSGVTHLAGVLGTPTVAIFGPSDPVQWAPWGPRVTTLWGPQPCQPCHGAGSPQCHHPVCRRFPSVDEVWPAMLLRLQGGDMAFDGSGGPFP